MTNLLSALPPGVLTAAVVSCLPVPATDLLWLGLLLVIIFYIIHNSTFTTDEKIVIYLFLAVLIEGTEKVPFFYDQNGKCLRFVTSLSANRLNKAKIDRK